MFCFFFKQKTAYEMRISDWSSDVCSSDLLEYVWVRGQGEYGHDHASRTRRRVEGIVGMGQMVQEVAIKQCFSLLLQANGGIQLGLGLAWQQRGQKMHVRRRRFPIDQKIRPGETEQCAQALGRAS